MIRKITLYIILTIIVEKKNAFDMVRDVTLDAFFNKG